MSNSEFSSGLIAVRSEKHLDSPEKVISHSLSSNEKMKQGVGTEVLAGGFGNVIWIKEELDIDCESQNPDDSGMQLSPFQDQYTTLSSENLKEEDALSPQPSTSTHFLSSTEEQVRIKLEPEFVVVKEEIEEVFCFYCLRVCSSLLSLKKHIRMAHSNLYRGGSDKQQNLKSFSSEFAPKKKKKPKQLSSTTKKGANSRRKLCLCPHCDYKSTNQRHLASHIMAKHTNEKPYFCQFCEYRSTESGTLRKHIKAIHTKEKPHCCPQCDYRTTESAPLKRHILAVHTNEKPHSCPECEYRTVDKTHLKRHILAKHTDIKPYSCTECHHRTTRCEDLKKHIMARHTKEKPYSCPHCVFKSTESGNLKRHILTRHTNENTYACPRCKYKTKQHENLKRHILEKHVT